MSMLSILLSLAAAALPAEPAFQCPAELPASAITVAHPPPGFTGFIPTKIFLNAVGFSTGPLEDRATLIGDYRKLRHGAFTITYQLAGLEKYDRWMLCQYGLGNEIVVARLISQPVGQCVVTYTPDKFNGKTIAVACK